MFKNIIKNQLQLVMVILLIFLSVFVFTISDSSAQRLSESRDRFTQKSNLHDAVIKLEGSNYNYIENDEFRTVTNSDVRNELVLSYLKNSLDKSLNNKLSFEFNRTEARNFSLSSNKTIKAIGLDADRNVDKFVVSNGMSLATWSDYANSLTDLTTKWVYVSESFAKANNIQINDIIRLSDDTYGSTILVKQSEDREVDLEKYENQDINSWLSSSAYNSMNWFQVVGYGSSADFMAPIVSDTSPLPNSETEGLIYVSPKNFGWEKKYLATLFDPSVVNKMEEVVNNISNYKTYVTNAETQAKETLRATSQQDVEVYYSVKFLNEAVTPDEGAAALNELLTDYSKAQGVGLISTYTPSNDSAGKLVYSINDSDYTYSNRTSLFSAILKYFTIIMYLSTSIIALIGVWILIIMLKNQIQKTFSQNGVLMSLGYTRNELIISNCLYPMFISIIGGVSGYLLALPFQNLVVGIFEKFFTIKYGTLNISLIGLLTMVLGLFFALMLITLLTYWFMFKKYSTLQMINYENITTTNKYKIKLKKILTRSHKFNSRFKGAILSSSISKFISITSVMLVSSIIVTVGVAIPNMLSNYMKYAYIDNEYDNQIEYQAPMYNAPTTFYKTYNPNSKEVLPTADASQLVNMYLNNEISSAVYNPKADVGTLTDLNYKNLNKDFLTNPNLELNYDGEGINKSTLIATTISSVWTDYKNYKLDQYSDHDAILDIINDETKLKDKIDDLENLRLFYLKYRSTIGLDIRRDDFFQNGQFNKTNLSSQGEELGYITKEDLSANIQEGSQVFPLLAPSGKIQSAAIASKSYFDDFQSGGWYLKTTRDIVPIYNWIRAFFIDNLQQGFLQGIYVSSPESMRKIMLDSFDDESKQFNTLFNVIPYVSETDDLGIYLNASVDKLAFKIYGIEQNNTTQTLINSKNKDLKVGLFENKNNIVVNESLARQLKLKVGDKVDVNQIVEALTVNGETVKTSSWDTTEMDAATSDGNSTNQQELYSRSLMNQEQKGLKNSAISGDDFSYIYNTEIDTTTETLTRPTVMSENVATGKVAQSQSTVMTTYTVSGISRQYGTAKAWIQNKTAKEVSHYNESEEVLFQIFLKEWANPKNYSAAGLDYFKKEISGWTITNTSEYHDKFVEFSSWAKQSPENSKIMQLFNAEYPIFNYKASADAEFNDVSKGLTSSQLYGDFSSYGLNGGESNSQSMNGYKSAAIKSAIQISAARQIQSRVSDSILFVVVFVIAGIILLCIIIIMLIVNLVIVKYQKIIAVMKVLGYKNTYILSIFIGMYIPLVVFTAIVGFVVGMSILFGVTNGLVGSGLVIPFFAFTWWYPFATLAIVWTIYVVSSFTSWQILKRVKLLLAVREG